MAAVSRLTLLSLLLWTPMAMAQQPVTRPPAGQAAPAQPTFNPADAAAVQTFIDSSAASCQTKPAQTCIDAAWQFAATSPKQGLSLQDAQKVRQRFGSWYTARQSDLDPRERSSIGFGLLMADSLGIPRVHAAFDANRDGRVSQQELLADVKLDKRPLGDVMKDPKAVDRQALARRLGLPPALLDGMFVQ